MTLTIMDFETGKVHVYTDAPTGEGEIQEFIDNWPHSSIEWMTTDTTQIEIETLIKPSKENV